MVVDSLVFAQVNSGGGGELEYVGFLRVRADSFRHATELSGSLRFLLSQLGVLRFIQVRVGSLRSALVWLDSFGYAWVQCLTPSVARVGVGSLERVVAFIRFRVQTLRRAYGSSRLFSFARVPSDSPR